MAQEDIRKEQKISLIAALSRATRGIGKAGALLWNLPEDMQNFKEVTMGHPVIMGRKTWESIPEKYRPLAGRENFVVTRAGWYEAPGATIAHSFPEALSRARDAAGSEEIFVIGGQEMYQCALPFADRLYLTLVESDAEADAFFPAYPDFVEVGDSVVIASSEATPEYSFAIFERK